MQLCAYCKTEPAKYSAEHNISERVAVCSEECSEKYCSHVKTMLRVPRKTVGNKLNDSTTTDRRLTHAEAGYIDPVPSIRCGTCVYFGNTSNSCAIVKGNINKNGCCNLWSNRGTPKLDFLCGDDIKNRLGW